MSAFEDLEEQMEWEEDMQDHYDSCDHFQINPREFDPVTVGFMRLFEGFKEFVEKERGE